MALILNIETSTRNCSVALAQNGSLLALEEHAGVSYTHAEELHPFIHKIFDSSSTNLKQIDAIAVSKGPGSFTGLRIGVSAAKGLCFALAKPLMAMDSLTILCRQVKKITSDFDLILPMIDARRMEVYTTVINNTGEMISPVESKIIDESFFFEFQNKRIALCGDGAEKCRPFLLKGHEILPVVYPSAAGMIEAAEELFAKKKFEDLAYFEPYYLKEFLAGMKKQV